MYLSTYGRGCSCNADKEDGYQKRENEKGGLARKSHEGFMTSGPI